MEISLAAMALSVVCLVCGVFLLRRRFISDARRVSEDCGCSGCGGGGGELELILAPPEQRRSPVDQSAEKIKCVNLPINKL